MAAATLILKVYNPAGELVAACKFGEDAAAIVTLYGTGAEIRVGHRRILWCEGAEVQPAGESYDFVATTVNERLTAPAATGTTGERT